MKLWETSAEVSSRDSVWLTLIIWFQKYNIKAVNANANAPSIDVKLVDSGTNRATALRQADAEMGTVVENKIKF